MSFNSKAYVAYEERRLEPDSVIVTGNYRRHTETSMAAKNRWLDSLTDDEREKLREDTETEYKNDKYETNH